MFEAIVALLKKILDALKSLLGLAADGDIKGAIDAVKEDLTAAAEGLKGEDAE